VIAIVALAVVGAGVAIVAQTRGDDNPAPRRASSPLVDAIAAALRNNHVVLIAERHGWSAEHQLLRRLLQRLPSDGPVVDVVVEFGNARYQALVDRYTAGGDISLRTVSRAWLETTQGAVWRAPDYSAFFAAVRTRNSKHSQQPMRVVLGDPPFDPERTPSSEYDYWILQRGEHFADVIHREVLRRGRRALVIAGIGHVLRRSGRLPTLTNLLEGTARCETDPLSIKAGIDWCDDVLRHVPVERTYVVIPADIATATSAGLADVRAGQIVVVPSGDRGNRVVAHVLRQQMLSPGEGQAAGGAQADAILLVGR
jgi:hypothetical protein